MFLKQFKNGEALQCLVILQQCLLLRSSPYSKPKNDCYSLDSVTSFQIVLAPGTNNNNNNNNNNQSVFNKAFTFLVKLIFNIFENHRTIFPINMSYLQHLFKALFGKLLLNLLNCFL